MRVSSETSQLDIAPGARADVTLDVVNTGSVIDGISARVVGMPDRNVTTRPAVLPLFPDSSGQLTVSLGLPHSFPAGRHPMTVEVLSRQPGTLPAYVDLDLVVPRVPALGMTSHPEVIRARRTARYIMTVTNRGNVALDVALKATDPQKICGIRIQPPAMTLAPGGTAESVVTVRARRMILGTEMARALQVQALARPSGAGDLLAPPPGLAPIGAPGTAPGVLPAVPPGPAVPSVDAAAEAPAEAEPITATVAITLRQRPYFTRGLLTALILLMIIALWAAAFLFGLSKVFAGDPMTKTAPASFFAATTVATQSGSTTGAGATGTGATGSGPGGTATTGAGGAAGSGGAGGAAGAGGAGSGGAGAAQAAAPAGALPKTGVVPGGVGGTISGSVIAASSGDPVGRILVQALRVKADGTTVPAATAATQSDGTFQVSGLFPATYLLSFSADGFRTSYYPNATTPAKARAITVSASTVTTAATAVVTGLPATVSGTVSPGNTTDKVVSTVKITLLKAGPGAPKAPIPDATTHAGGQYTISNLPAPATYQLTFVTPGYQTSTVQAAVIAGAHRYESTVVLSAGNAQISGTVTDGTTPLGGATVSTTVGGKQITTGTPTTGQIGHFVIGDLPTPATYVITVSKSGFGQVSQVIDLAPGKPQNNLTIMLAAGTGVVNGRLVDSTGVGLGGATVTVGGLANPPSTVTLTNGAVGTFQLTGLPAPGSYTLTFTLAGYAPQTVPVTLTATKQLTPITVTMPGSVGSITGTVTGPGGAALTGVTVTATDGQHAWPVITTGNSGGQAGRYTVANLPAGLYTVTASNAAGDSQTTLVTVASGPPVTADFHLAGG